MLCAFLVGSQAASAAHMRKGCASGRAENRAEFRGNSLLLRTEETKSPQKAFPLNFYHSTVLVPMQHASRESQAQTDMGDMCSQE